ncbi:MAG: segregation/condensation protein A [candidate division Zixibacteria bacterium]|nr:segregation/condensation protein A [candidate division Zixibacteria bacterium]
MIEELTEAKTMERFAEPLEVSTEVENGDYSINISVFEGPMDLLLYLIEKGELDIYNIPIAKITKQYLEFVEVIQMLDLDLAGEFMVMAARLMQVKARLLLPATEEDEEEVDPRTDLIQALVEYRRVKKAAEIMGDMESISRLRYPLTFGFTGKENTQYTELEVNLFDLLREFREVMNREIPEDSAYEVQSEQITVEERIDFLLNNIDSNGVRFIELFNLEESRLMMIVTLIALLELVRLNKFSIRQNQAFGEIWMYLK